MDDDGRRRMNKLNWPFVPGDLKLVKVVIGPLFHDSSQITIIYLFFAVFRFSSIRQFSHKRKK